MNATTLIRFTLKRLQIGDSVASIRLLLELSQVFIFWSSGVGIGRTLSRGGLCCLLLISFLLRLFLGGIRLLLLIQYLKDKLEFR